MYTAKFKIYFEDNTEVRQGKVFPRPKDTVTKMVLNVGLIHSKNQLREVLCNYKCERKHKDAIDELIDMHRQRINRKQVKQLESFFKNLNNAFYRILLTIGKQTTWLIYDHHGFLFDRLDTNEKYLSLGGRISYEWKNIAEYYLQNTISNGAFIAGCILYGIPIDVNNCYLNPIVRFDKVVGKIPIEAVPIKQ
jgi:hypothetical protein